VLAAAEQQARLQRRAHARVRVRRLLLELDVQRRAVCYGVRKLLQLELRPTFDVLTHLERVRVRGGCFQREERAVDVDLHAAIFERRKRAKLVA